MDYLKGFSRFVVKHRVGIIIVAVLLLIPAFFGYVGTYVNYDILTYLPSELDSMVGQSYLEDDFNLASTAMITVEHMPTPQLPFSLRLPRNGPNLIVQFEK